MESDPSREFVRTLGACGAIACSVAVAMGAYAAHVAVAQSQHRLGLAALFLFGHGLAIVALASRARSRLQRFALVLMLFGMLLFSGSLALAVMLGTPTLLAPYGGSLLILGWLLLAAGFGLG